MAPTSHHIHTSYGTIHVLTSVPPPSPSATTNTAPATTTTSRLPTILLIHGGLCSSRAFKPLFESPLAATYRIIAPDLPGHGKSANVGDENGEVERTYCFRGCAETVLEVLRHLDVRGEVVLVGHSLGGMVGLEVLGLVGEVKRAKGEVEGVEEDVGVGVGVGADVDVKGVMIVGTVPCRGREEFEEGYITEEEVGSEVEVETETETEREKRLRFVKKVYGEEGWEEWMVEDAERVDKRALGELFRSGVSGEGRDYRGLVRDMKEDEVTLAVVVGKKDRFVKRSVLEGLRYGSLWRGGVVNVEGCGHSPFWDGREVFERILGEFVGHCFKVTG